MVEDFPCLRRFSPSLVCWRVWSGTPQCSWGASQGELRFRLPGSFNAIVPDVRSSQCGLYRLVTKQTIIICLIFLSFTFDISFSGTFCSWREHRNLGEFTFHNVLGWFFQNNKIFTHNQVCGCGGHLLQVAIDGEWKCQECGSTRKPSEVKIMIMTIQLISMMSMLISMLISILISILISVTTMRISMMTEVKGVWGRDEVGRSNRKQGGKSQSFWGQYRNPPTCHSYCHH